MEIGLIGCGRWGRNILRDLRALGANVHVADSAPDSASVHATVETLPGVDGYVVATPSTTHAHVVDSLLATGRPIFVEKPMATSVDDARRLARDGQGRLFVMDKWRYHAGIETLRREIDAGTIGRPEAIRLVRWSEGHDHKDVSPLWILAPHDLSIVLHLFGGIPPVRSVETLAPGRPGFGLTATLCGASGPKAILDVGAFAAAAERRVTVVGSGGLLELHGADASHLRCRPAAKEDSREAREIPFAPNQPLAAELEAFLHFLRGGPAPLSSADEGLLIVERLAEIEAMAAATS